MRKNKRLKILIAVLILGIFGAVVLFTENSGKEVSGTFKMKLTIKDKEYSAIMENNSSASALKDELKKGKKTIHMSDYGRMEKVGELGKTFPRNDREFTTKAGDLVLYQGNKFVVYYDSNKWSFTKLGHIENVSLEELRKILGDGEIDITLSLP